MHPVRRLDYTFTQDTNESHLYNMTTGPDGALYFADAAANAIICRAKSGQLSVVTAVPGMANPNPAGPTRHRIRTNGNHLRWPATFNSLVENEGNGNYLALEFAVFGPTGFTPKTGRLLRANSPSV